LKETGGQKVIVCLGSPCHWVLSCYSSLVGLYGL